MFFLGKNVATKSKKGNAGFNLIEAAIVLGVVGLVIGGIWVAAASISHRLSVNKMLEFHSVILRVAASAQRTLSTEDNYHVLAPLLREDPGSAGLSMPASNRLCSDKWCVIPMYVVASGRGHLTVSYYTVRNGSFALSDRVADPAACVAISTAAIRHGFNRIDGTTPFIEWAAVNPVYSVIGTYSNTAAAPPSIDQIMTYCRTANVINFANIVP